MPALNFKAQFADAVESGMKRQTIRATRKRPINVGDKLYLYTGMRTKQCRKLGEAVCRAAVPLTMQLHAGDFYRFKLAGRVMTTFEKDSLALADGFRDFDRLAAWFEQTHGLPFEGQVIRW